MEKNNAKISFDAALQMALYAQMERELETMPSPEELKSLYPQTTRWDERIYETLQKQEHKKRRRNLIIFPFALAFFPKIRHNKRECFLRLSERGRTVFQEVHLCRKF